MKLRIRLTILIGAVITITILFSTLTIYKISCEQLEQSAAKRLQASTKIISAEIESRLFTLLERIKVWAKTNAVKNALLHPNDSQLINSLNNDFINIVKSDPILQTVNLLNQNAACVASSIPERIGLIEMQQIVSKKDDFITALSGKPNIMGAFMAISSGRPILSIAVPVFIDNQVAGVLRPIIDVAWFNESILTHFAVVNGEKVFVFHPGLNLDRYKGHPFTLVIKTPYTPPDIPSIPEIHKNRSGIIQYASDGEKKYAAFLWMDQPHWLLIVEQPLSKVLQPITHLKYTSITFALIFLFPIWLGACMATKPLLANIMECRKMVRKLQDGHLDTRVTLQYKDDIQELAIGLNQMATKLQEQTKALKDSETKYRNIFKFAVEGIFLTTSDGKFISTNQALAKILGVSTPDELISTPLVNFYVNPEKKTQFMAILNKESKVSDFEVELKRMDGNIRQCIINARLQIDETGQRYHIQGVINDITEKYLARQAQQRAVEAEKLVFQARYEALRYQINPHFLFNVLNSIDALAKKAPGRIEFLLQKLSTYLRYTITKKKNSNMLQPLKDEINAIEAYLAVEKIRFQDNLIVMFDIKDEVIDINVPDMLLQPLVENAIKYGMLTSDMPLKIKIEARLDQKKITICVRNSGQWHKTNNILSRPGIGLTNLKERLELIYGEKFNFNINPLNGWVNIILQLDAYIDLNKKKLNFL